MLFIFLFLIFCLSERCEKRVECFCFERFAKPKQKQSFRRKIFFLHIVWRCQIALYRRDMPSACFDAYSNVSTHWKHAEGMSLRYGVAIFCVCERGLEKRGAPPLVWGCVSVWGDVLFIFDIFCAVLRAGCSSSARRWSLDLRHPELG